MNQFLRKYRAVLCAVSIAMAMTSFSGVVLADDATNKSTEPKLPGKGIEAFGVGSKEEEIDKAKTPEYDPFLAMVTGQIPSQKADASKEGDSKGIADKTETEKESAAKEVTDSSSKFSNENPVDAESAELPVFPVDKRIEFEWKPVEGASKYRYKIFNVKTNKAIKHVSTIQTKGYLPEDKNKEGTYRIAIWVYDKEGKEIKEYQMYFHAGKEAEAVEGKVDQGDFYFDAAAMLKKTAGKATASEVLPVADEAGKEEGPKEHRIAK